MKVGTTIDLTNHIEEKDGYTYSITLDGEEIAITDLKEYDVLSVAAANTGKSIEEIARDTERDNFMTAKQALEYGLVDKILYKR